MLSEYQNLVERKVRDDTGKITPTDIETAIGTAVTQYSKDRPRLIAEDVTAPGGQVLDLPEGWVMGFSELQSIEYPMGDIPPTTIENWELYLAPAGESLMLGQSVDAGQSVRLVFSVFHTLSATADTLPQGDRDAVASLAASLCLEQLAILFSGDSDSTIQADSVEHAAKGREFAARSRAMRKRYYDDLGVDPKRNAAAGVVVDLDQMDSRGRDRLTHPGRYR